MEAERKIRIGHYADKAFPLWAMGLVALSVLGDMFPSTQWIAWVYMPLNFASVYVTLMWHRGLCEKCMGDTPLNGSELAEKYRRERSLVHLCDRWRLGRDVAARGLVAVPVSAIAVHTEALRVASDVCVCGPVLCSDPPP